MVSGPTHAKSRKKRKQALRRLKRAAMQNHMALLGWVPVKLNSQFGIYHHTTNRLVLRKWHVPTTPQSAFPYPYKKAPIPAPAGYWWVQALELTAPFNGEEIAWNDIQLRWVMDLRSAAIGKGWL